MPGAARASVAARPHKMYFLAIVLLKSYEYFRKATILMALKKIIVTLAASYPRQSSYAFRFFFL